VGMLSLQAAKLGQSGSSKIVAFSVDAIKG
jgi:hypothetical protein